jgi:putative flavoprotein involved in K+ transport
VNLDAERIGTVLLATGYRPHHPWLHLPITGPDSSIQQYRGVTAAPGMYVVGQRFQHRRDSAFIDGARHDAEAIVRHLLHQAGEVHAAPCIACEEPAA